MSLNLDKKQKVLLVLVILAFGFIVWQLYSIFGNGSSPAKNQPAVNNTAISAKLQQPTAMQQQRTTPTTTGSQPTQSATVAAPKERSVADIGGLAEGGGAQSQYVQIMNQYQVLKMKRLLLEEEVAIASARQRIAELNSKTVELGGSVDEGADIAAGGSASGFSDMDGSSDDMLSSESGKIIGKVVYIDNQDGQWHATLNYKGKFTEVTVGSELDGGVQVIAIDKSGVVLKKGSKLTKLTFSGAQVIDTQAESQDPSQASDLHHGVAQLPLIKDFSARKKRKPSKAMEDKVISDDDVEVNTVSGDEKMVPAVLQGSAVIPNQNIDGDKKKRKSNIENPITDKKGAINKAKVEATAVSVVPQLTIKNQTETDSKKLLALKDNEKILQKPAAASLAVSTTGEQKGFVGKMLAKIGFSSASKKQEVKITAPLAVPRAVVAPIPLVHQDEAISAKDSADNKQEQKITISEKSTRFADVKEKKISDSNNQNGSNQEGAASQQPLPIATNVAAVHSSMPKIVITSQPTAKTLLSKIVLQEQKIENPHAAQKNFSKAAEQKENINAASVAQKNNAENKAEKNTAAPKQLVMPQKAVQSAAITQPLLSASKSAPQTDKNNSSSLKDMVQEINIAAIQKNSQSQHVLNNNADQLPTTIQPQSQAQSKKTDNNSATSTPARSENKIATAAAQPQASSQVAAKSSANNIPANNDDVKQLLHKLQKSHRSKKHAVRDQADDGNSQQDDSNAVDDADTDSSSAAQAVEDKTPAIQEEPVIILSDKNSDR